MTKDRETIGIEGSPNLVRDVRSHAIINKDGNARKSILEQREKRKQAAQDLNDLKDDVKDLKATLATILEILEKKQ